MATPVKVKEALKNAGGRPPKPESERTVVATVRLTPKRKARLKEFGANWLSQAIDDEYAARQSRGACVETKTNKQETL